jgi:thiamine biosynthesis lipoprotein
VTAATTVASEAGRLAVYRTARWSTTVELVVTDPRAVAEATGILQRQLDRIDQVASRFRPDSEINALHSAAAHPSGWAHPVSDDLFEAVTLAVRAASLTDGAVDPTVGSALCALGYDRDFSALAGGVPGRLPAAQPVPGWQTVVVDNDRRAIGLLPGTVLDLGATAKAWAADRACAAIADQLG